MLSRCGSRISPHSAPDCFCRRCGIHCSHKLAVDVMLPAAAVDTAVDIVDDTADVQVVVPHRKQDAGSDSVTFVAGLDSLFVVAVLFADGGDSHQTRAHDLQHTDCHIPDTDLSCYNHCIQAGGLVTAAGRTMATLLLSTENVQVDEEGCWTDTPPEGVFD